MTTELERKVIMWQDRATELEFGIEKAIKTIKVLRDSGNWSYGQKSEINQKIEELENILIPF